MSAQWTVMDDEERGHAVYVCAHLGEQRDVEPATGGCEECLALGEQWVSLRMCLTCGHVGCCDSSRHRHARAHFTQSQHPLVASFNPDQGWGWCYPDNLALVHDPPPPGMHTGSPAVHG